MYVDRHDAGRQLAICLRRHDLEKVLVVGLNGGGVPVAAEIAEILGAPLDVLVVREFALPGRPHDIVGAVAEGSAGVLDEDAIRRAGIGHTEIRALERSALAEIRALGLRIRNGRPRQALSGRNVILADDGTTSRLALKAACRAAREQGVDRVVLALPVASPGTVDYLRTVADEVKCPLSPVFFVAASNFYLDFRPVSDDEAAQELGRAAKSPA